MNARTQDNYVTDTGSSPRPASGWYPDPADATRFRFFDGYLWTGYVRKDIDDDRPPESVPPELFQASTSSFGEHHAAMAPTPDYKPPGIPNDGYQGLEVYGPRQSRSWNPGTSTPSDATDRVEHAAQSANPGVQSRKKLFIVLVILAVLVAAAVAFVQFRPTPTPLSALAQSRAPEALDVPTVDCLNKLPQDDLSDRFLAQAYRSCVVGDKLVVWWVQPRLGSLALTTTESSCVKDQLSALAPSADLSSFVGPTSPSSDASELSAKLLDPCFDVKGALTKVLVESGVDPTQAPCFASSLFSDLGGTTGLLRSSTALTFTPAQLDKWRASCT